MTKHLLAIGLMLIALPHVLRSQSFEFHSNNPFGIQIIGEEGQLPPLMYMFHDMDNDSDVDLIMAGIDSFDLTEGLSVTFFLDYQLNLGTSSEPMFGPRQSFEDFKYPSFIFLPTAGDLNNDGRIDIVAGLEEDSTGTRRLIYYRNSGINTFDVLLLDDMGIPPLLPESIMYPKLMDLDADGDLDLFLSGSYPTVDDPLHGENYYLYAKNVGTREVPEFLGWFDEPYDLIPDEFTTLFAEGDIDNDGDVDLLSLVAENDRTPLLFLENIPGVDGKPSFAAPVESPFGLPVTGTDQQFFSPVFTDIDSDGDLDFFVLSIAEADLGGELQFNGLAYYENVLITATDELTLDRLDIEIRPNPVTDRFYIENHTTSSIEAILIYRTDGTLVRTIKGEFEEDLRLDGLVPDTYFVRIRMKNKDVIRKVVLIP